MAHGDEEHPMRPATPQGAPDAERAARDEIERVSVMKDEFLATLSHELRTPLNAVLGWSEILLSRAQADPDTRRGLEIIARNARAQAQLIDDLLDMNRIVSGKVRLDVQRLDLAAVVEAALESARPSAEAKSITVQRTVDPHAGPVFGDPGRLQQVVWNLLANSVKFTPRGGRVEVAVQRAGAQIEVTVRDTGIGISAAFLPHIFERFRQADSTTTRRYGGLGLGLAIVKQLVELHGGTVRAESAGDNRGATFVVSLPLRVAPGRPSSGHYPAVRTNDVSLAGIRVLVVDDDPSAREQVMSVLVDAFAEVWTAASAAEALALLGAHHPDVIVSDIEMPQRDGYALIRDVRARRASEGGRTPAIALSGVARSEDRTRALLAGYQVLAARPIDPLELVATVRSLVYHRRR
ncbi:MAG: hybrid sensor histidine kinase/response regulator [Deltaproteobacteria bacterium]|nr:hybrid sensor histidine kinase/response regulator [Myxococcales bacterium]MDP3215296.1 hybrid sensor histidine kinase/response regulator [Deltaproteobacteria bacterium]